MNINCERIFFISDLHFGVHSNSIEWLEIERDYYNNWFMPLLEKEYRPGDVLFVLGDIFDNRQSINLLVLNTVLEIFEKIRKIIPIYIILGNHDLYRKTSNDINSVKILSYLKNITVFQEPTLVNLPNNKTICLMPWRANEEEEKKTVETYKNADYLFCHTDVNGLKYNNKSVCKIGNSLETFKSYDRVFAGHIHYRQESKNTIIVGSPYALTRGDKGNKKGIYLFYPNINKIKFIENTYSPVFLNVRLERLLNTPFENVEQMLTNNFTDISCPQEWSLIFPFSILLDNLSGYRNINVNVNLDDNTSDDIYNTEDMSDFNIKQFTSSYVSNLPYTDKVKVAVERKISSLYDKVVSGDIN